MTDLSLRRAVWLLVWSLLWSPSLQQDSYIFTNPPPDSSSIPNPTYNVGDDINLQWVGPNAFVSVRLVHVLPSNNFDEFTSVFTNVTNLGGHYTWKIDLGSMNLTTSKEFFFNIFVEGETSPRAITHYFNLTRDSTSTTAPASTSFTTSASSSTSTSATSSTTSSPTKHTNGASATNTVVPSSGDGLSSGAKAGIGVGVAVGVIAFLAAATLFWRSRRGKNGGGAGGGAESGPAGGPPYQPVNQQGPYEYYKTPGAPTELSEAPANHVTPELSGNGPTTLEMADTSRPQN
ncbi:conserved hypothetical protein [Talaromyces stipitatus ATCC 10500]|uniref:Mid2 domain-containing protein n=1 Tax=Talaromyces stipitatus (strain ATCC 10500 / CBS 375.48 / QM 6759 / NRRL 1006) TaxID=441959 RepID=B8M4V9_TALSN|nr:uncharacterized protein TSTA_026960 [Talaromyces stipitatus ATCC 10500]EED19394.1 conserved hypothetical protein [Talaromyces stipitatus ATCC 10500]